jgi:hypothetical protein
MIRALAVRTFTIFYSWQSDRESQCCKNFIRIAADDAARRVGERLGVEVVIDADTEGVSGTTPISETILKKIGACDLFLADLSLVSEAAWCEARLRAEVIRPLAERNHRLFPNRPSYRLPLDHDRLV